MIRSYSKEEKKYWRLSALVLMVIFLSLFINRPIIKFLTDQGIQAFLFWIALLGTGAAIVIHAIWRKPRINEFLVIIGMATVYIMLFLRLGLSERSHLIEYSILAIFIHKALELRSEHISLPFHHSISALLISMSIGLFDEILQFLVPHRHFDPEDILFNCLAILIAIGGRTIMIMIRKAKN